MVLLHRAASRKDLDAAAYTYQCICFGVSVVVSFVRSEVVATTSMVCIIVAVTITSLFAIEIQYYAVRQHFPHKLGSPCGLTMD